jgi:hypothetical protein
MRWVCAGPVASSIPFAGEHESDQPASWLALTELVEARPAPEGQTSRRDALERAAEWWQTISSWSFLAP